MSDEKRKEMTIEEYIILNLGVLAKEDCSYEDVARFLEEHNLDINAKGLSGCTPLHLAVAHEHKDIVSELIKAGADVNAKVDEDGHTSLHLAVLGLVEDGYDVKDIVSELIEAGADVNAKDYKGQTPLSLVEKLINEGSDKIDLGKLRALKDLFQRASMEKLSAELKAQKGGINSSNKGKVDQARFELRAERYRTLPENESEANGNRRAGDSELIAAFIEKQKSRG